LSNKWQVGPVKLANGEEAVIDAINEEQEAFRYTGRIKSCGRWVAAGWDDAGRMMYASTDDPRNLAPPPKKKVRVRMCINCYGGGAFHWYRSRQDADECQGSDRIACKEIDIEVEEGEGL
jgi:hypothetical protein